MTAVPSRIPGQLWKVSVVLASHRSGGQQTYLLADTVHHCLQLNDQDIAFLTDIDADLALRTREELISTLAETDIAIGMSHFPGLDFYLIAADDTPQWVRI